MESKLSLGYFLTQIYVCSLEADHLAAFLCKKFHIFTLRKGRDNKCKRNCSDECVREHVWQRPR